MHDVSEETEKQTRVNIHTNIAIEVRNQFQKFRHSL